MLNEAGISSKIVCGWLQFKASEVEKLAKKRALSIILRVLGILRVSSQFLIAINQPEAINYLAENPVN